MLMVVLILVGSFFLSTNRAQAEEVYFFRGGFNVFSRGMDDMANQLRHRGVNATSLGYAGWRSIANNILARAAAKQVSYPIVVVGHSFGADVVTEFANYLGSYGVGTALVIGLDPTGKRVLHQGARRAVNYRCSDGKEYLRGAGFKGTISQSNVSQTGANHFNIDKTGQVQDMIMREILATVGQRKARRRR